MRAENWMDRTPVPTKTPLQQAQADMRYWKQELADAEKRADECRSEFRSAVDRVARL